MHWQYYCHECFLHLVSARSSAQWLVFIMCACKSSFAPTWLQPWKKHQTVKGHVLADIFMKSVFILYVRLILFSFKNVVNLHEIVFGLVFWCFPCVSSQWRLWLPVWCRYSAIDRGPGRVAYPRTRYSKVLIVNVESIQLNWVAWLFKNVKNIFIYIFMKKCRTTEWNCIETWKKKHDLCVLISSSDELLSSQERAGGMKDVIVSVETSKDSDADSSKPSSKATSLQNSPAIQKGQTALIIWCLSVPHWHVPVVPSYWPDISDHIQVSPLDQWTFFARLPPSHTQSLKGEEDLY